MIYEIEIYPPLKDKVNQPIAELKHAVVDTGGQGRLILKRNKTNKHVSSCAQYHSALQQGFTAYTNESRALVSFYTLWCGSLNWLAHAKTSTLSYVKNFNLTTDYASLPSQIFFTRLGDSHQAKTLIEKYPDATLTSIQPTSITLDSKKSQLTMVINLLARADFSNNSQQDLLVSVAEFSHIDNFKHYGIYALQRNSKNGAFKKIEKPE